MENEETHLIKKLLDIALRRKTILILCLLLGVSAGLGLYLKKPKIYQCTALLKYQRQSVNPSAMSPDDSRTRPEDVVDTVSQEIMSRSSLEGIIKEFDLYSELRETVPMEEVVERMKKEHIQTNLLEDGDVFRVSYQGKDQEKVMKATNALASKFIEENLRFRQEKASQTSSYIRDELEIAKKALDEKEIIMRDYKLKYYNEMPEQLANNTSRLNALQEQYQNNQSGSLELERTRLLVQEQIADRVHLLNQLNSDPASALAEAGSTETDGLNSAQKIRLRLQQLSGRYTDRHPEIKRLKKLLRDYELNNPEPGATNDEAEQPVTNNIDLDPQIQELRQQLHSIELNLDRLEKERQMLEQQIQKYETWITTTPVREAEWSALTRDYEQLNEHYQQLVTQNLQAESVQSLENQLRGSQFKIVDLAHFPEKPIKPDFRKLMLVAIFLSLGAGGVISVGIEILNPSIKDPIILESALELPIVCTVPVLYTRKETTRRRLKAFFVNLLLSLAVLAVLGSLVYFYLQGKIFI